MLGSASLIVLDDTVPIALGRRADDRVLPQGVLRQVHPLPRGHPWLHKTLVRIQNGGGREEDLDLLLSVSSEISGKVLCALGDFATSPVVATIRNFRDEYVEHIRSGRSFNGLEPCMTASPPPSDLVTLTIDGREVKVPKGTLVVEAAKTVGIEIPVFCYHPKLKPVGACRMCLVEIEKMPRLQTACTSPVAEGMVVRTTSRRTRSRRRTACSS